MAAALTAFGAVVAVAAGLAAGALIPLLYGAGFAEACPGLPNSGRWRFR